MNHDMASDGPTSTLYPVVRSEIWFEDGNVVLEAERKQFKVHRGMLARSSSIFRDMFAVPQPPKPEEESVDGCVVVRLPDSAEDVEIVLQALVERGFAASREPVPIKVVAAFLRLGQKYDFEAIRIEALHRIFYEVPITLKDYDTLKTGSQIQKTSEAFWIDILTLAHEHNLQSVLPFALYMCSTVDFFGLSATSAETDRRDEYKARLSIDDQMKCLSSYQTLLRAQNHTTFAWLDFEEAYQSCDNVADQCGPRRNSLIRQYFFNSSTIGGLEKWENGLPGGANRSACVTCDAIANEIHTTGRRFFWQRLPEAFKLPAWEELREERAECLKAK